MGTPPVSSGSMTPQIPDGLVRFLSNFHPAVADPHPKKGRPTEPPLSDNPPTERRLSVTDNVASSKINY